MGETLDTDEPAFLGSHSHVHLLPSLAVPFNMAVYEIDLGAGRTERSEQYLHLARAVQIGFDLLRQRDVPRDHQAVRWVVGQDVGPTAFASIDAPIDDLTAHPRFEDHLRQLRPKDVMVGGPPAPDVPGEDVERLG
jgi:hypothetical protein